MSTKISSVATVPITGAHSFTGVLGANDTMIAIDAQTAVHMRYDPDSTAPNQGRHGGLPVPIAVIGRRADDFGERLSVLERKTRELEDYSEPEEGRD